jgi:hypothetical protein
MTVLLYNRRTALRIQPFPGLTGAGQNRELAIPWDQVIPHLGFDPIPEGLRVRFTIEKSIQPEPNRAKIDVFNLNPEHRGVPGKDDLVTLQAGYATLGTIIGDAGPSELPIIFKGNLTTVAPVKEKEDWILRLASGDGATALKKAQIVDLIPKDASIGEVVDKLVTKIKNLGVEVMGDFSESILHWATTQFTQASSSPEAGGTSTGGDDLTKKAKALAGKVNNLLTGELDKIGLTHSVQNNVLVVRPKGGADPLPAILLSDETGLLEVARTEQGIKGKALMIAGLEPGRRIDVRSPALSPASLIQRQSDSNALELVDLGVYVVTKTTTIGDTHGQEWAIAFEALTEGSTIDLPS